MDITNEGTSVYHRTLAAYSRSTDGQLGDCFGKKADLVRAAWPEIWSHMASIDENIASNSRLAKGLRIEETSGIPNVPGSLVAWEINGTRLGTVVGLILQGGHAEELPGALLFDEAFLRILLPRIRSNIDAMSCAVEDKELLVQRIIGLFERTLLYRSPNDRWFDVGRSRFQSKVEFFVSRNLRLELCLPAFPCKSSNLRKVLGVVPDKGEELALRRLHEFVRLVKEIYDPGARVLIVSDGHVFSDCIGVDDDTVDTYGTKLKELNAAISKSIGGPADRVQFQSLVDLFNLKDYNGDCDMQDLKDRALSALPHYLATTFTEEAELCRRMLITACQPSHEVLRSQLNGADPALLALYRGFSRFMLEDLAMHPVTQSLSRSKQKKLSSKVAFEMMLRNQAYSNLVELMFPSSIRLSIHAHSNTGPKFAIRLFDPSTTRVVDSLDRQHEAGSMHDLLHIPTPWHNCIVQFEGNDVVYVTKAVAVEKYLSANPSGWRKDGDLRNGRGAYFFFKPMKPANTAVVPGYAAPIVALGKVVVE